MNTPMHSDMPYLMPILELKKHLPQDLCKIIDYYAVLIEVLRAKLPERITYTIADKAKMALAGYEIKNHLGQTINLVTPATIMRWFRELKSGVWFYNNAPPQPSPPSSGDRKRDSRWIRLPRFSRQTRRGSVCGEARGVAQALLRGERSRVASELLQPPFVSGCSLRSVSLCVSCVLFERIHVSITTSVAS
jgi:hypothetical protein